MKSLYLSDVGDNEPDVVEEKKVPQPPLVDDGDDDTGDDNDIDFGDDDEDEDDEN